MKNLLLAKAAIWLAIASVALNPWTANAAEGAASMKGRVVLNGVPLAEGKLLLHKPGDKDKAAVEAPIKAGEYVAPRIAPGMYVVTIEGAGVPAKYTAPDVSGLKVEVKAGDNTIDFELRSK